KAARQGLERANRKNGSVAEMKAALLGWKDAKFGKWYHAEKANEAIVEILLEADWQHRLSLLESPEDYGVILDRMLRGVHSHSTGSSNTRVDKAMTPTEEVLDLAFDLLPRPERLRALSYVTRRGLPKNGSPINRDMVVKGLQRNVRELEGLSGR